MLWGKSAGRCQFCNKVLYRHSITDDDLNVAEAGHIIGQGEKGPRNWKIFCFDEDRLDDIDNLMLLCLDDHLLIDRKSVEYSVELLREKKYDHEERVKLATESLDSRRSVVIKYISKIGDSLPTISKDQIRNAMFPDYYPIKVYELGMAGNALDDSVSDFWTMEANNLEAQFGRDVRPYLGDDREINHYSIFAYATVPLLIKLGTLLPNIYPVQVYHHIKTPETWRWEPETPLNFDYYVSEPEKKFEKVALKLSLSGDVADNRVFKALGTEDVSIWSITVPETEHPKNDHLRTKEQLALFSRCFNKLLNQIKLKHGEDTKLHLFPAIGVAYAVEIGRVCSQKADIAILVYDQNKNNTVGGFLPTITINGRGR